MGGQIGVHSSAGHGAEFWFTVCFDPALGLVCAPAAVERNEEPGSDLTGVRSALKTALTDLAVTRNELLAALPLTPLIPKSAARRVEGLRARVSQGDIACIFPEPQFEPKLLSAITARARVKTGILDPEGAALTPGPTLYFDLMRGLARGFAQCLASP